MNQNQASKAKGGETARRTGIPTISRVCADRTIIELVYDPEKHRTGLVVSRFGGLWNIEQEVRIETGDTLIPYSANNNLITSECVLLPSKPVEFGFKHELLADIRAFLNRYVDLSPLFGQLAAHYVLLTWVYDAFNELPYLRLRGDFGTGKTRCLQAIGSLCYRPFFASGASTVSPLFHVMDAFGGTLVLDEADLRFSDPRSEIIKILNNGTMRGMPVLRTMQNRHKEFNPQAFKVFGPKIIGMREGFEDKALESRLLTEEMGVRPLRADIPIHLPTTLKSEALELRNRLLHYRLCHLFDITTRTDALIEGVAPRVNQMAISLLSLVDEPQLRHEMQQFFLRQEAESRAERSETVEAGVLTAALSAFAGAAGPNVPIRDVADHFNVSHDAEYGGRVSNRWIGHILRRRLHLSMHKSGGVYVVPISEKPKLDALAARFGL